MAIWVIVVTYAIVWLLMIWREDWVENGWRKRDLGETDCLQLGCLQFIPGFRAPLALPASPWELSLSGTHHWIPCPSSLPFCRSPIISHLVTESWAVSFPSKSILNIITRVDHLKKIKLHKLHYLWLLDSYTSKPKCDIQIPLWSGGLRIFQKEKWVNSLTLDLE